ncbi:helix-turn-helix domain-containing protein, partial [Kitasatospora putterlickiae]
MGRREKEIDPADGPVAEFAHGLRTLRQEAGGPTYRRLAARAGYSATTLAQAADGARLPSLPVVLAYVGACGGDLADWERRWHTVSRSAADRRAAEQADADDDAAPYRGLARFDPADHDLFFGRDRPVAHLLQLVRERRLVVLVGPSGSGKSSLLRAGLVPRLRDEPPPHRPAGVRILTPGPQPART